MTKFSTHFLLLAIGLIGLLHGQTTIVQDFETGSNPTFFRNEGDGNPTSLEIVPNPSMVGNTTATCAKIGRVGSNWFELIAFAITPSFTVAANDTKYLHIWVYYTNISTQPDLAVRTDAPDADTDGTNNAVVRDLLGNPDILFDVWQDVVIPLAGGASGLTLDALNFHADMGFQSGGFLLNNVDKFAYVDEFRINDDPNPEDNMMNVNEFRIAPTFTMYPNPTNFEFSIKNTAALEEVSIFDALGRNVKNFTQINEAIFDVSDLETGNYVIKVLDVSGGYSSKCLVKE